MENNALHGTDRVQAAMERLQKGNVQYLTASQNPGDISAAIRQTTARDGQHPFAIVMACSDSRVIPENIFMCGIGELFTIRVAGNVIDDHQLGSIEYAASHLDVPLTVILGHTYCGAVEAAMYNHGDGYIRSVTDVIQRAIGEEKDDYQAARLNVEYSVSMVKEAFAQHEELKKMTVAGAVYDTESGKVLWQ